MLRPLSTGEILDVSFGLYRKLFVPLVLVSLVTAAVPLILNTYMSISGGAFANPILGSVYVALALVMNAVATAATVFIISESYLGRALSAGEALSRAVPFIGRLFVLAFLTGLVVGIGLILLIIPGLVLLAGLILAIPVMVLEESPNALGGMGRSWELSRGFRGKVLGIVVTVLVIIYIPSLALGGLMPAFTNPEDLIAGQFQLSTPMLILAAVSGILQLIIFPFFYCALTVLYYDLRIRKEGFDLEVLAARLQPA
jgi:hypothetical protein